jgi:predicted restriction endonuclease
MTDGEVLRLFETVNCARLGTGYAPHKPIVMLLALEMLVHGHENSFAYRDFDAPLRRLLTKYGSPSAAEARNEPFWRLVRDGVFEISTPYSFLIAPDQTPTPVQLIDYNVSARMPLELFQALQPNPGLVSRAANAIATKFFNERLRRSILVEAAPTLSRSLRRYWWVSQNRTYREELLGNFMWSPRRNSNNTVNPNYEFMRELLPGDIVFNFADSAIKAVSVVRRAAVPCPKPSTFGKRGDQWADDGWLIEVACYELRESSIRPQDHMALIGPTLPDRYSPIRASGVGNQVYLTPVPALMANVLLALIGSAAEIRITEMISLVLSETYAENEMEDATSGIADRHDIGPTEKEQLIRARRGQGLFRIGLYSVEERCRITQVSEKIHLIASHIKPWSESSDLERLSKFNGLLLAPHADHLFDKGFISFDNAGTLLISKHLDREILNDWHIDPTVNVGSFRSEQHRFLEYHRDVVLKR